MAVEDAWFMIDQETKDKVRTKRHGRGKRWRVRNRGARTVSFHKKSDAEAHDTEVNHDLLRGVRPFDHKAGHVLFEIYAAKCVSERYHNERSRRNRTSLLKTHLIPYFGKKRMCDIQPSTVSSFRAEMRTKPKKCGKQGETLAVGTIEVVDALLVMIMRSAVKDKVVAENPCEDALPQQHAVKRQVQVWEQEIVDAILDELSTRYYPIALLSATCGHRQGESFAVATGDIRFLRKEIVISHQVQRVEEKSADGTVRTRLALVPPKGGKIRTVPLPTVTNEALAAHIQRYGTTTIRCTCCGVDHDVLFADRGALMDHRVFNTDVWAAAVNAAGTRLRNGLTASRRTGQHQLRHVYASTLIEGSASMEQVRDYMGHASIMITASVYGHLFERSHERARSIIDQAYSPRAYPRRTAQDH